MKNTIVKAIKKRVLPFLMVAILLLANCVSITVYADEPVGIDNQGSSNDNNEEGVPTEEKPVVPTPAPDDLKKNAGQDEDTTDSTEENNKKEVATPASGNDENNDLESEPDPEPEPEPADETAPQISDIEIKTEDAVSYEGSLGDVAASQDSDCFAVTAKVVDDGTGVKEVLAVEENGTEHEMTAEDDDTYSWFPDAHGNYKISKIIAKDNADNSAESDVTDAPIFCYYSDEEITDVISVSTTSSEWYSNATHPDSHMKINISGKTVREIKEITVAKASDNDDAAEDSLIETITVSNEYKDGKYNFSAGIELPDEEGVTEYQVAGVYCGDEDSKDITKKTVKIDNTAPSANVIVDGEEESNPLFKFFRWINPLKWFTANKDITVLIKVPKKCDGESEDKEVSGFNKITYRINDEREITKSISQADKSRSDDEYYVFVDTVRSVSEDGEDKYDVKVLSLVDAAGNANAKEGIGNGSFVVDKAAPKISYSVDEAVAKDEERLFYKGSASGTVTISDINLDDELTKFEDSTGKEYTYVVPKFVGSEDKSSIYNFKLENDGTYKIKTYAEDKLGQWSELSTKQMIVDTKAPEISIEYGKGAISAEGNTYYASNVQVTVTVKDKWIDKQKSFVYIKQLDQNGSEVSKTPLGDWTGDLGDNEHVITFTTDADGTYQISAEAYDMSGNHDTKEGTKFIVDTTVPEVTLEFDENDPANEKYYNKERTATLTVKDFTFYNEGAKVDLDQEFGGASVGEWTNSAVNTYTRKIKFAEDGKYSLKFNCVDRAGNKSKELSEKEFVIDRTAPEIKVTYNTGAAVNDKFYKETRVANVNIKEMSFDGKLVELETQQVKDPGVMPGLTGFSSYGDSNVAQISFSQDGTYGYKIKCSDLAGNTATEYVSEIFTIDKTAPKVVFSGVENFSANNAEVAPRVVYEDKYIDIDASSVVLRGYNNGVVQVGSSITPIENGFSVAYSDFAHDKSMDDLYTLEATVRDKAGNETKERLVFSVNRHGSVFVVGKVGKEFNNKYYINEPKDITITEINIDELTLKDVSISRDGNIKELRNGRDYSVKCQGGDTSWKTYTYTVSKSNFNADGIYSVTVYTKDRAQNVQDNKSRDAEVTFAIDRTAPGIVTSGIEQNGEYKQKSLDVNINVTDNMGVDNLVIFKDGNKIESCTREELQDAAGVKTITLSESDKKQEVTIVAEDYAGNKETVSVGGVLVSTKEVPDEAVPTLANPDNSRKKKSSRIKYFAVAVATVASMAVGGCGIALLKIKRVTTK
ncbi:MAG: Ig-like domain repeat protein [Butyrivibrio sp.]|nr:Ig-like domain repeat protein [Butyrivibrio sp.]